jgi:hypothetical protein
LQDFTRRRVAKGKNKTGHPWPDLQGLTRRRVAKGKNKTGRPWPDFQMPMNAPGSHGVEHEEARRMAGFFVWRGGVGCAAATLTGRRRAG